MWKALYEVAKALLGSKKFVAGMVGVIAAGAVKFGWHWSNDSILTVLSPLIAAIVGQGAADLGKEAAKVVPPLPAKK